MSAAPSSLAGPVIDRDVLCMSCGYNLRGLSDEKVCPECSAPVGQSLLGDRLEFANPRWLRRIGLGAFLAALAMIVQPVTYRILVPLYTSRQITRGDWYRYSDIAACTGAGLVLLSGFLLTTFEGHGLSPLRPSHRVRWIFRSASAAVALYMVSLVAFSQVAYFFGIYVGMSIVVLWYWLARARLAFTFARRIPAPILSILIRISGWVTVSIMVATSALGFIDGKIEDAISMKLGSAVWEYVVGIRRWLPAARDRASLVHALAMIGLAGLAIWRCRSSRPGGSTHPIGESDGGLDQP